MPRHVRRILARFISVTVVTLLTTAADSRAESPGGDPLFGAARRALSREISTSAVARALRAGLWSPSREAVAASYPLVAGRRPRPPPCSGSTTPPATLGPPRSWKSLGTAPCERHRRAGRLPVTRHANQPLWSAA